MEVSPEVLETIRRLMASTEPKFETYSDVFELLEALDAFYKAVADYSDAGNADIPAKVNATEQLLACARQYVRAEDNLDQVHRAEDALRFARDRVLDGEPLGSALRSAAQAAGVTAEVVTKEWQFFHGAIAVASGELGDPPGEVR